MTLPPEGDDAISPHSPLRPTRKSFAYALRTAAVPPGRRIGTRECSNVKPLRLRDTALAALLRCLLQLRCCTPLPICNTLFQRLALLSDTSLVQSAFGRAFSLRSPLRAGDTLSSPSFPNQGALALFACRLQRIYRQWNTSANILRYVLHGGQRHGSTSNDRSGSEQEIVPTP